MNSDTKNSLKFVSLIGFVYIIIIVPVAHFGSHHIPWLSAFGAAMIPLVIILALVWFVGEKVIT